MLNRGEAVSHRRGSMLPSFFSSLLALNSWGEMADLAAFGCRRLRKRVVRQQHCRVLLSFIQLKLCRSKGSIRTFRCKRVWSATRSMIDHHCEVCFNNWGGEYPPPYKYLTEKVSRARCKICMYFALQNCLLGLESRLWTGLNIISQVCSDKGKTTPLLQVHSFKYIQYKGAVRYTLNAFLVQQDLIWPSEIIPRRGMPLLRGRSTTRQCAITVLKQGWKEYGTLGGTPLQYVASLTRPPLWSYSTKGKVSAWQTTPSQTSRNMLRMHICITAGASRLTILRLALVLPLGNITLSNAPRSFRPAVLVSSNKGRPWSGHQQVVNNLC